MLPRNTLQRRKPIKYLKKVNLKLQADKTKRRSLSFAQLERYGKAKTISKPVSKLQLPLEKLKKSMLLNPF
jgi:hypothetical protein